MSLPHCPSWKRLLIPSLPSAPWVFTILALFCRVSPSWCSTRRSVQRWDQRRTGCCTLGLAANGRSEWKQRCDWQVGNGQRVRAAGERLQQGGLRRVQWGGVPAHPACTRWGHTPSFLVVLINNWTGRLCHSVNTPKQHGCLRKKQNKPETCQTSLTWGCLHACHRLSWESNHTLKLDYNQFYTIYIFGSQCFIYELLSADSTFTPINNHDYDTKQLHPSLKCSDFQALLQKGLDGFLHKVF